MGGDVIFPEWIYHYPLHGVRLLPAHSEGILTPADDLLPHAIRLAFSSGALPDIGKPVWLQESRGSRYVSVVGLHKTVPGLLLDVACEGVGSFHYLGEEIVVNWSETGTGFEHYLQTAGLSLWLEIRGVLCLHANALATERGVIGLVAPSQMGKTTLTAALAASGMAIMTDDMMAVYPSDAGWRVFPGWPRLRMWPDAARYFVGDAVEQLARVHTRFDKRVVNLEENVGFDFCRHSGSLNRLYLLERRDDASDDVVMEEMTPRSGLLALMQHSMLASAYRTLGVEEQRLEKLSALVTSVVMKKIVYSSGRQSLERVCKAIQSDL